MDERSSGQGWRVLAGVLALTTVLAGAVGYQVGSADEAERAPAEVVASDEEVESAVEPATTVASGAAFDREAFPEARPLLARTAADGTGIRVVEAWWPREEFPADSWIPPAQCMSIGNLEIGLVADDVVAMGWSDLLGAPPEDFAVWGSGWGGHPQLGPFLYGAVRVVSGVGSVRLVRDGEVLDEVEPNAGWAIVAARVEPYDGGPGEVRFTDTVIEVLDGDGNVVRATPLGETDQSRPRPECTPPPAPLPPSARPAGPDDASAVDAISGAYRAVFESEQVELRANLTGGEQLDDALLAAVREGAENIGVTPITVKFHEVGFVDEDTAVVVFNLEGAPLGWIHGDAVRVDGAWKVDSQTWCSLVSGLGVSCPPDLWDMNVGRSRYSTN